MLITLKNEHLRLIVDTHGAQMMNLQTQDGTQYLWQGDSRYWSDRAPLLFPFIARLTDNSYLLNGTRYHMGIHGFAAASDFSVSAREPSCLTLTLSNTPEIEVQYPFAFRLCVTYMLISSTVNISWKVTNLSKTVMPFGIGGHPGFRVPLCEGEQFEDYRLTFSCSCQPDRIGFTPNVYLSGHDLPYSLVDRRYLPLRHELFDEDAIVLKNMAREVTLQSDISHRGVIVSYPDLPYLGIWHQPHTDAPYVCIEPWSSLPSRQGIVEELTCKSDLIHLAPGRIFETTWSMTPF